ncbi:hypothetical protein HAX54_005831 [Datura stramonium]|uniref:Uncharacterized protein n=1 Tax=Datura stramonium TaxID=4076 RepID=A0ABS8T9E7_DATST|nr:hypothetical protein [Datura stramonium]
MLIVDGRGRASKVVDLVTSTNRGLHHIVSDELEPRVTKVKGRPMGSSRQNVGSPILIDDPVSINIKESQWKVEVVHNYRNWRCRRDGRAKIREAIAMPARRKTRRCSLSM